MYNKGEKSITLNSLNIIGKKVDINIDVLDTMPLLEEVILKNIEIGNEITKKLNSLTNLKRLFLVNCNIITEVSINNINNLDVVNCKNIDKILLNDLKAIIIENCRLIDIQKLLKYNLNSLQIINTEIVNLNRITKFKNLRNLSLNEIRLTNEINFNEFEKLEYLNLDGSILDESILEEKAIYVDKLQNKFKCSFAKKFNKVG